MKKSDNKKKNAKKNRKRRISFLHLDWYKTSFRWTVSQPFKWLWTYLCIAFLIAIVFLGAFYIPGSNKRFSSPDYRQVTKVVIHYNNDNSKYKPTSDSPNPDTDPQSIVTEVKSEINYILDYGQYKNLFKESDFNVSNDSVNSEIVITGNPKLLKIVSNFNNLLTNNNKITITSDTGGQIYAGASNPLASKWKTPNPSIGPGAFNSKTDKFGNNWKTDAGDSWQKPLQGNIFKSTVSKQDTTSGNYILNYTVANTTSFKEFTKYLYDYLLLKSDNKNPYDPSKPGSGKLEDFRLYIWINFDQFLKDHQLTLDSFNAFNYCFQGAGRWDENDPTQTYLNPSAGVKIWNGTQKNYHPAGLLGVYTVNNTSTFSAGISSSTLTLTNSAEGGKQQTSQTHHFAAGFGKQAGDYINMVVNNGINNYSYYLGIVAKFPPRSGLDSKVFWLYGISFLVLFVLFAAYLLIRMRLWGLLASILLMAFTGLFISVMIYSLVSWGIMPFIAFLGSFILMFHLILSYFSRIKNAYLKNKQSIPGTWHETRSRKTWIKLADFTLFGLIFADIFYVVAAGNVRPIAFFLIFALSACYVFLYLFLQLFTSTILTSKWCQERLHLFGIQPWSKAKRTKLMNKPSIDLEEHYKDDVKNDFGDFFGKSRNKFFGIFRKWKLKPGVNFNKYKVKKAAVNLDTVNPVAVVKKTGIFQKILPIISALILPILIIFGSLLITIWGPLNGDADMYGSTEFHFHNASLSPLDKDSNSVEALTNDINKELSNKNLRYSIIFGNYSDAKTPSQESNNALILNVEANSKEITNLSNYFDNLKDLATYNFVYDKSTISANSNVSFNIKSMILGVTYALLAFSAYLILRFSVAGAFAFLFSSALAIIGAIFAIILFQIPFSYPVLVAIYLGIFFGIYLISGLLTQTKSYLKAWNKNNRNKVISKKIILSIFLQAVKCSWKTITTTTIFLFIGTGILMVLVPYFLWAGVALMATMIIFWIFMFMIFPLLLTTFENLQSKIKRKYFDKAKKLEVNPEEQILPNMNEVRDI